MLSPRLRRTAIAVPLLAVLCAAGAVIGGGCGHGPSTGTTTAPTYLPPSRGTGQNTGSTTRPMQGSSAQSDVNMALGNPSNAVSSTGQADNYLLTRPQYSLSYNKSNGGPNWVSWHVQASDLGKVPRSNNFAPDPALPPDWQIRPNDYTGSGFDRGHQCPSGDRTASPADNSTTFYMSNMLPQAPDLNRQVWEKLEAYSRNQVQRGQELYIVAGGHGSQSRLRGKVNVPADCWKVILLLPQGDNDLARIDANTRVIAVDMPNTQGIGANKWQQYITTVASIEQATGLKFFSNLPPNVQAALKAKRDTGRAAAGSGLDDGGDNGTPSDATSNDATPRPRRRGASQRATSYDGGNAGDGAAVPVQQPYQVPSQQPDQAQSLDGQRQARGVDTPQTGNAQAGQVWVNLKSGVYHLPGTRWYGNTKDGQFMSEAQAQAAGYRAAENGQ